MAIIVEVVEPQSGGGVVTGEAMVVEVVNTTTSPATSTATTSAIEVVGHNVVQNAVVAETEPVNPYEGMVWIQV